MMDDDDMAPPPPPPAMMEEEEAMPPPPPAMDDDMMEQPIQQAPPVKAAPAAPVAVAAPMGVASAAPGVPVMHGTYDRPDEEEEVMVKTEFVWADGAENDVKLSGSWNGWMPVQMYHEGGGMWSVVTPVPTGTHEFKFVVDGEWRHSTRHPTVGDDEETMNNIRVIRGPPKQNQQQQQQGGGQQKAAGEKEKGGCCVIS